MHPSPALAVADQHRLARAFLALGDGPLPQVAQRSLARSLAAFAAAAALAVASPLTWFAPAPMRGAKPSEQPAATLGSSKAVQAADDDEDAPGD